MQIAWASSKHPHASFSSPLSALQTQARTGHSRTRSSATMTASWFKHSCLAQFWCLVSHVCLFAKNIHMLLSPLHSQHYKRKHALGTHVQDQVQPWLGRDLSTVDWHNFDVWYLMFVCLLKTSRCLSLLSSFGSTKQAWNGHSHTRSSTSTTAYWCQN